MNWDGQILTQDWSGSADVGIITIIILFFPDPSFVFNVLVIMKLV